MFNQDFYPTPLATIQEMLAGYSLQGKTILEPSSGKGDIVDYLKEQGANVIACELNDDLRRIVSGKCKVIGSDFLKIESHEISHIDMVVMNPPFSNADEHILHAWEIAPKGCEIVALCNLETVKNGYSKKRLKLREIIERYGSYSDLGECFATAERRTNVEVALIKLSKPSDNENKEFEGFFLEDDQPEEQANGIMPYNVVRDLVQRYIGAVKLFDKQLEIGVKMNELTGTFFKSELSFECTEKDKPKTRNDFKKDLQKSGWNFIFDKMNLNKYATKGLREDINTFVEKQTQIPFTMKNIYKMLEIVIGTTEQRMDKAILEVFDKLTQHHEDNRYAVEGWKTNSHYLMNEKFILPYMCPQSKYSSGNTIDTNYGSYFELMEDMVKALCFMTGQNYDDHISLSNFIRYQYKIKSGNKYVYSTYQEREIEEQRKAYYEAGRPFEVEDIKPEYGQIFTWGFFEVRAYKKGTMHFKFRDQDIWARFNQRIAKLKGYALYESKKKREKQPA